MLDERGDDAAAETMYQRVLAIDPDDVNTLHYYGFLLKKRGDIAAAKAMYQRVLAIDPDHVITLCNYGVLQLERGEHDAAEAEYLLLILIMSLHCMREGRMLQPRPCIKEHLL